MEEQPTSLPPLKIDKKLSFFEICCLMLSLLFLISGWLDTPPDWMFITALVTSFWFLGVLLYLHVRQDATPWTEVRITYPTPHPPDSDTPEDVRH